MTLSEVRKTIAAIVGGVVMVGSQLMVTPGIIPQGAVPWITLVVAAGTALMVYLVPNEKNTPAEKAEKTIRKLEPLIPSLLELLQKRRSFEEPATRQFPQAEVSDYPFRQV